MITANWQHTLQFYCWGCREDVIVRHCFENQEIIFACYCEEEE